MTAKDISQLRAYFDIHCIKCNLNRIDGIKFRLEILANGLCTKEPFSQVTFSEEEKSRLVNLATAIYLAQWLENDKNAAQSINSFITHRYRLKSEEDSEREAKREAKKEARRKKKKQTESQKTPTDIPKLDYSNDTEAAVKRFRRAYKKYHAMQHLQHVEALVEGRPFKPTPVRNYKRPLDFITLRFLDLHQWDDLALYELLLERKKLLGVTSEKKSNASLRSAYERHNEMIEQAKTIPTDREYVVACMQLYKYETAFRFRLNADLARNIKNAGKSINTVIPREAVYYWGRYTTSSSFPGSADLVIEHFDLLNYSATIQCLFDTNTAGTHAEKVACWRELLAETIRLLDNLEDPRELPSWSEADFHNAATFFKNDYPIIENYVPLELDPDDKNPDSYYNYIRALYKPLTANDDLPLSIFRREIKKQYSSKK